MAKIQKINKFFKKVKKFLIEDIYFIDQNTFNPIQKFLVNIYRVITFAITDFFKDDCTIRAAALTYLVTLSFIPALIVGLFIFRIFNIYQNIFLVIFDWMEKNAPFYEPMVRQILNIADNTNLASFGIIGIISTIVSTALILHSIQSSLVKIWRVKITTSIPRVVANYIALLFLIPILIGVSFTLITYTSINLHNLPALIKILLSWVTPIILTSILVLFSYVLVPQTKVNWSNAAISSILVAIAIITLFSVYFKLNINVKNYKQIFDSDRYKIEYIVKEINTGYTEYNDTSNENIITNEVTDTNQNIITNEVTNANENILQENQKIDVENITSIKIERISYVIMENVGNGISGVTYEKKPIETNMLNFKSFSPNVGEQLVKYNFKIDDVVTISSENNMLTSITPAELSSASSFAQIPVLLLLLYIVWIIILFGAELTYSIQYFRSYGIDKSNIRLSFAEKEAIALEFMYIVTYRFINKKKAITMYELAKELRTAPTTITEISDALEKSMFVIKIVNGSNISYTLGCQPESITIGDILYSLRMDGGFRSKNINSNDKYKNIIYQNKAISIKDYNTNLLHLAYYKNKK
ncbi:YhjD/YihY/BrkB family envelope integrity protein [Brachyspira innocens]|uniref:YhjD/YihY/BrkB family envelope integrity protein n=1 Tax=Brachyspira innocens TaxID=13264 RepID=A0ABT8Z013_9SPIR|nr:YhjD/YihY/BrkB family envelope integrity protein [Brachyspira innocens]MDO6994014.1 YhjD/YihY/BrkB family envelope integrity protein [Brachyspira innocens]MDO7021478.1 YhjD/YihY/BrkB family envelope integrity protein [Brachyspira innocens]